MAFGRLFGGRLLQAWGERRLLVGGTLLAAVGALAAVTTSTLWLALAGFVVVGLGLANVFPLAIARAGVLGGCAGDRAGHHRRLHRACWAGRRRSACSPRSPGCRWRWARSRCWPWPRPGWCSPCPATRCGCRRRASSSPRAGSRLQPLVAGVGHGAGAYARDLQLLVPAH